MTVARARATLSTAPRTQVAEEEFPSRGRESRHAAKVGRPLLCPPPCALTPRTTCARRNFWMHITTTGWRKRGRAAIGGRKLYNFEGNAKLIVDRCVASLSLLFLSTQCRDGRRRNLDRSRHVCSPSKFVLSSALTRSPMPMTVRYGGYDEARRVRHAAPRAEGRSLSHFARATLVLTSSSSSATRRVSQTAATFAGAEGRNLRKLAAR